MCREMRYPTLVTAAAVARTLAAHTRRPAQPEWCDACQAWHVRIGPVASQEPRSGAEVAGRQNFSGGL